MPKPLQPFNEHFNKHRADALAAAERLSGARGKLNAKQIQALYDAASKQRAQDDMAVPIGYALGELIIERSQFQWMAAFDEFGSEPVVAGEAGIFCAPLHMIGRRLENGEAADIDRLANDTIGAMREAIKQSGAL